MQRTAPGLFLWSTLHDPQTVKGSLPGMAGLHSGRVQQKQTGPNVIWQLWHVPRGGDVSDMTVVLECLLLLLLLEGRGICGEVGERAPGAGAPFMCVGERCSFCRGPSTAGAPTGGGEPPAAAPSFQAPFGEAAAAAALDLPPPAAAAAAAAGATSALRPDRLPLLFFSLPLPFFSLPLPLPELFFLGRSGSSALDSSSSDWLWVCRALEDRDLEDREDGMRFGLCFSLARRASACCLSNGNCSSCDAVGLVKGGK